jgi:hypothetical protein
MTTLALITLLCLAALAAGQAAAVSLTRWELTLETFTTQRQAAREAVHQARLTKCRWHDGAHFRKKAWQIAVWNRDNNLTMWRARADAARRLASRCELSAAWAWHYGSAASCVRSKEGGLTSVNPAGPYYGWYQADADYQAAYGPEFYRQWGPGIWHATAQVLTAYRGWRARGWNPWPNTARECGLL